MGSKSKLVALLLLLYTFTMFFAFCAKAVAQEVAVRHYHTAVLCEPKLPDYCTMSHVLIAGDGQMGFVLQMGTAAKPEGSIGMTGAYTLDGDTACFVVDDIASKGPFDPPVQYVGVKMCFRYDKAADTFHPINDSTITFIPCQEHHTLMPSTPATVPQLRRS